jgi:heat-inducible transcriptional repressor
LAVAPRNTDFGHNAFEEIVGLRPHDEEAVGDDVRWDPIDPELFRFGSPGIQVIAVSILTDRGLHRGHVDGGPRRDLAKDSEIRYVFALVPVGLQQFVMHGVEAALLPGEFGGLEGGTGVDQPVMQREMKADSRGHSVDPFLGLRHVGRRQDLVARPPFRWDLGVQLEGHPLDLDVVFPLQPLDPDRVDVAEGSNVVRVDPHGGGHAPRIAGTIRISTPGSRLPTMMEATPLDERKQRILKAVVSDYTLTGVPVGSQVLAAKYFIALSSATIRNELADLVGTGYLQQPHTSAGRIPTDRGYRYFVDFLMEPEAASSSARRTVKQEFESTPRSVDGILEKAAMVLSQVTQNVSLVTAPEVSESRIKHVDLVSLEPQAVLIILVLEGNLIKQQVVHLDRATSQEDLSRMAAMLNQKVKGQTADELAGRLDQLGPDRDEQRRIIERLIESITIHQAQRQTVVLHDGVRNLLRHPEFVEVSRLEELLELLEQGAQLASILQQVAFEKDVEIIIGQENTSSGLRECSLVLTTYTMADRIRGTIGVIGPTRMHYGQVVARVRLVSHATSEVLAHLGN